MDRDTREYCPNDWESVSKVEELEAEINNLTARLNLYKTLGDDRDATISELTTELTDVVLKNESLMAEIAELKEELNLQYNRFDEMHGTRSLDMVKADAIREMLQSFLNNDNIGEVQGGGMFIQEGDIEEYIESLEDK